MASNMTALIRVTGVLFFLTGFFAPMGFAQEKQTSGPAETQLTEMVYVPEGEFIMGTSEEEAQQLAKENQISAKLILLEAPKRKVNLNAFWIDRFPVTNRQFMEFLKATNHARRKDVEDRIRPGVEDNPVVDIDYDFAADYAKWAGKRLPTAEEWEKAARGTDGRLYPWGNEWKESATHRRPAEAFMPPCIGENYSYTVPVGCFPEGASPYGVMDMCGNVAEYTSTPLNKEGQNHVIKGARATCSIKSFYRCASVAFSDCDGSRGGRGFRCAKDATEPPPPSYKLSALERRTAPPLPQPTPPREDLYLKEPIQLEAGPKFKIPYLPDGSIALMAPESLRIKTGEPDQSVRLKETPYTSTDWQVSLNRTRMDRAYTFSEKQVSMRIVFESHMDYVDYRLTLKNDSADTTKAIRHMTCQCCSMPYFYNHEEATTYIVTDAGPQRLIECMNFDRASPLFPGWEILPAGKTGTRGIPVARLPFVCTVSADGKWARAVASPGTTGGGSSNANYCCIHLTVETSPLKNGWIELKPGEEHTSMIRYYFIRGGVREALERWKKDFGK